MSERIVLWPVEKLVPYAKNSRMHDPEQITKIAASITEFGFTNPILVDGKAGIIAGHGRLMAAKELGLAEVPVIELTHLSDAQKRAYVIADNKLTDLSGFDDQILSEELKALDAEGFDLDVIGFDDDELAELLEDTTQLPMGDADEAPEPPAQPKSRIGDLWILGNHRVLCGDSTSIDTVEKLMNGEKTDMVFTDPPYNTGMGAQARSGSTRLNHFFEDSFTDDEWQDFMSAFCSIYWTIMKDNSVAYICLDWRRNFELIPHIKKHFTLSNTIVWDKVVHGLGSDYKYTYELINVCKKGKPTLNTNQGEDREYSDVWHIQRVMGRDDEHATKKPIELVERPIRHASKAGHIITDLFGGSGSTLIACEKTKRRCFMMELDPKYVDVIISRWQKYSGKKAIHAESGKSFDDLAVPQQESA